VSFQGQFFKNTIETIFLDAHIESNVRCHQAFPVSRRRTFSSNCLSIVRLISPVNWTTCANKVLKLPKYP
jgi:hypothetical protein